MWSNTPWSLVGMEDHAVVELTQDKVEYEEERYEHHRYGASMEGIGNEGQNDKMNVIEEAQDGSHDYTGQEFLHSGVCNMISQVKGRSLSEITLQNINGTVK